MAIGCSPKKESLLQKYFFNPTKIISALKFSLDGKLRTFKNLPCLFYLKVLERLTTSLLIIIDSDIRFILLCKDINFQRQEGPQQKST